MQIRTATTFVFACGIGAASGAAAQPPYYADVTSTHLPPGLAGACMDAAAGDADGDGDLDLALAMEFEPNRLLLNAGDGRFTDASERLPRTVHDSEDVAFADFDGDGDLDLVLVSEDDRTDELYVNDGAGRFADASGRLPTDDVSNALAVLDLDGDGAMDVLTGNVGINRVLINDGRGGFTDETERRWPQSGPSRTQDLELADVDGDGDLDVVVGNEGPNQLFVNEAGRLVDATARALPPRDDETREIRAGDVDGDGDVDLVVANVRFVQNRSPQNYVLLNDGSGSFTADETRLPADPRSTFTVQLADLDRDGDLDVVAPSTVFPRAEQETALVFFADSAGRLAVARGESVDLDGGAVTLVDGARSHRFASADGRLVAAAGQAAWDATTPLDDVDFDGDGAPDLAGAGLWLDTPAGGDATAAPPPGAGARRNVQLVDVDRDGDVDVVIQATIVAEAGEGYRAFVNDGVGRFAPAEPGALLPASVYGNGFDVEVADFDADGIADIFLCNRANVAGETAAQTGGRQQLLLGVPAD